jgi:hypothetical protein
MTAMLEHLKIVAITFCMLSAGCTDAVRESQAKITTKRADDMVDVEVKNASMVFSVHSPFGISQAIIESTSGTWPDTVMLRLHLKGLENLKVTTGKVKIEAAVSSQDGQVRLWKDSREEEPLDSKSPYWTEIRIVGKDGKPVTTIPLEDGYFEIQLPNALFEDNPKSVTINWIDFYR